MEGIREQYKRALEGVKDLTRYLKDSYKDMDSINIRDS